MRMRMAFVALLLAACGPFGQRAVMSVDEYAAYRQFRVASSVEADETRLHPGPGNQDVATAAGATQPEVRPEPVDEPRRATARVGSFQPDHVPQSELDRRALSHGRSTRPIGWRRPRGR